MGRVEIPRQPFKADPSTPKRAEHRATNESSSIIENPFFKIT